MLKQKMQYLLLAAVVVAAVVILSSFLVIGSNEVRAQAQNEGGNAELAHFLERQAGQLEAGGSPENTVLESSIEAGEDISGRRWLAIGSVVGEKQDIDTDRDMAYPGKNTNMAYQGVYTDVLDNLSADVERKEGQLEVVGDLKSAAFIGGQSTGSGSEYIPSSAFRHDGSSPASGFRFWPTAGYIRNNSSSYMCLAAPVYVPHGATLTEFSMYFMDDHPTSDMWADLWRSKYASPPGSSAEWVTGLYFPGIDEDTIWRGYTPDIQPGTETVSNAYGYYISFCFDPDTGMEQLVYGFRVSYAP